MASLRSVILNRGTRFLPWRNPSDKNDGGSCSSGLSFLTDSDSSSLHPSLSLCLSFVLPHRPLRFLLRIHPPPLRHPLPLMASTVPQESSPSIQTKTIRVVIKGRVQGVFYRDWTVEKAKELGLKGWVRNRRDGSVEALFSGSHESVEEMEQCCRRGPPPAMVTGLQVFPVTDHPGPGFARLPTV